VIRSLKHLSSFKFGTQAGFLEPIIIAQPVREFLMERGGSLASHGTCA